MFIKLESVTFSSHIGPWTGPEQDEVARVYLESSRSLQHAAGVDLVHVLVSAGLSKSANQLSKMRITVNFHNSFTFNF